MSVNTPGRLDRTLCRHALQQLDARIVLRAATRSQTRALVHTDAIVVPARNEADRLDDSLAALGMAIRSARIPVIVIVVLNDNGDDSSETVLSAAARYGLDVLLIDVLLPVATGVGLARRIGCHLATTLHPGVFRLHTSDADAQVERHWLARAVTALDRADVVCGRVEGVRSETQVLPASIGAAHALEQRYLRLMLETEARLDPDPANPWPHHGRACGASLSFRRTVYERVGGFAPVCSGEDTGLIARMRADGATVRFANEVLVLASCRLDGRAPHGMAAAISQRLADPDSPADAQLEPALVHLMRIESRVRVRRALARSGSLGEALVPLGLAPCDLAVPRGGQPCEFGQVWATIEQRSAVLARRRLRPSELVAEIAVLERALANHADVADVASCPAERADRLGCFGMQSS